MSEDFLNFADDRPKLVLEPWMADKKFVLVTADNITACIDACIGGVNGRYALDLETTGLDNRVFAGSTVDKIVGVCLSGDGVTGWYIPLRHTAGAGHNVPWSIFDREFRRLMEATSTGKVAAVFHNGRFDQEFLEHHGGIPYGEWSKTTTWEDTQILAYLRNSRARVKTLKSLAAAPSDASNMSPTGGPGLGMKMFELDDLFPTDHKGKLDFGLLDPSEESPLAYGCSDAICTWLLCETLLPAIVSPPNGRHNQKNLYRIEKSCVAATRWMERNRIPVDPIKIVELIQLGQQEWYESILEVYRAASELLGRDVMPGWVKSLQECFVSDDPGNLLPGQVKVAKGKAPHSHPDQKGVVTVGETTFPMVYDVEAPQQLGKMFLEMQVPGLVFTEKSGQVKTSKAELDRIVKTAERRFPFMRKIKRFRETSKALSNYLRPLLEHREPSDDTIRISFNAHKVDTGRFSTPSQKQKKKSRGRRMVGWPEMNFHAIPKTGDANRPACMSRLRECIKARPGFKIVAVDFSGQELRIIVNLSGEPKWLEEFFRCSDCDRRFPKKTEGQKLPPRPPARCPNCGSKEIGDIHTLTGINVYGRDAPTRPDWKELRGNSKGVNFGLSYGGGVGAVQRAAKCDKNEGYRIKKEFSDTYSVLQQWWELQKNFGRRHGYVLTAFGRVYPVPEIVSKDGRWRSKAERNAVNGPIQGSGADLCKIAMALVYRECRQRGWLDTVKMIATMHDELVFEIKDELLEEAVALIDTIMTGNDSIAGKAWRVPFTTDCEIGPDWSVPWHLAEMRHREVRFDGDKKLKAMNKPKTTDFATTEEYTAAVTAAKTEWDALSSWPDSIRPFFGTAGPEARVESIPVSVETGSTEAPTVASEPVVGTLDESAVPEAPEPTALSVVKPNGSSGHHDPKENGVVLGDDTCEYVLQVPLSYDVAGKLALAIRASVRQGGTRKLKILLPDGRVLDYWDKDGPFLVNASIFEAFVESAFGPVRSERH